MSSPSIWGNDGESQHGEEGADGVADGYFIGGVEVGYPLQLPVVDIIEIGAGGGSIAHIDETGALKTGRSVPAPCPAPHATGAAACSRR